MASVVDIHLKYKPRKLFEAFHNRTKRFALLVVHRRAGKTVAVINDLVMRAISTKKPNAKYAYIGPFLGQAKAIAWAYLKQACTPIPNIRIFESTCSIQLPNGALIRIFGADNEISLRGHYFDGICLDEVGDMKRRVWTEVVRPTLMDRRGWVVFIGTPKGQNFFFEMREKARTNPDIWYYLSAPASQTGILPQEELDAARNDLDDDEYRQEFEVDFSASIRGSYYGKILEELGLEGRILEAGLPPDPHANVHLAFDLGISDTTACWFFQIAKGRLLILDHWEDNGLPIPSIVDQIIERAKDRGYKLGKWYLPHDARARSLQTGKSTIEQIASLIGFENVTIGPEHNVQDGIAAVRKILSWDILFDGANCMDGINALKAYSKKWDAERKVYSNKPLHDGSSNSADAFRYLACVVQESELQESGKKKRPPPTPEEAKKSWESKLTINISEPVGITLGKV